MIGSDSRFGLMTNRTVAAPITTMRRHLGLSAFLALFFSSVAAYPLLARWLEGSRVEARLSRLGPATAASGAHASLSQASARRIAAVEVDPALLLRVEELGGLLASWQTVGGCGAGAGSSSSAGLKWVGRNVTGGLFNVQEQVSYSQIGSTQYPEHNFFVNTLITADVAEKWNFGVVIPLVYKYLDDPLHLAPNAPPVNYSNGGLGDMSLLFTRKLGRINATQLTAVVGAPTGKWDATYTPGGLKYLNQSAQLGFGKWTGALVLDQTMDQVWGVLVFGGVAAYRGGTNKLDSYRAPTATAYGYAGYFWGPLVPSFGLSLSGFKGHDIDQNSEQNTPLVSLAANVSLEWSTDWIAVLLGASIPYKYDGISTDASGVARSPWGFMPYTVALGVAFAPF